ncbi:conserved protein, unknown function, partial [Hepatocystis sp. ex Piliocolobus tephrosceles]
LQNEQLQNEQLQNEQLQNEQLQNEQLQNEQLQNEQLQNEQLQNEQLQNEEEGKQKDLLNNYLVIVNKENNDIKSTQFYENKNINETSVTIQQGMEDQLERDTYEDVMSDNGNTLSLTVSDKKDVLFIKKIQEDPTVSESEDNNGDDNKIYQEAEKLNKDIPYISNIHKELHRCPVMPLRIEGFHSLEDQRLIYGRPDWQKYLCPLCDKSYYPPNYYQKNYTHYINIHWNNRKTLGGYIIFPCKLIHDNDSLSDSNNEQNKIKNFIKLNKKIKKKKKNKISVIDPHYHCPLCLEIYFTDYNMLIQHCSDLHKSSAADPTRTLPSNFVHTPFTHNNDYYSTINRLASEIYIDLQNNLNTNEKKNINGETELVLSTTINNNLTNYKNNIINNVNTNTNQTITEEELQEETSTGVYEKFTNKLLIDAEAKRKRKSGRVSKVAFFDEIKIREYDMELSRIEKFGACVGPVATDDEEEEQTNRTDSKETDSKKTDTKETDTNETDTNETDTN